MSDPIAPIPPRAPPAALRAGRRSARRRRRPLRGPAGVWALTGALAAAVALVALGPLSGAEPLAGPRIAWWWLAPAFAIAERCVVHLHFRRSAHTFSLGDVPLVLGLIFATPHDVLIAGVLANLAVLTLDRQLPPVKIAFNLVQFAAAACVAILLLRWLVGDAAELFSPAVWLAVAVAMMASAALAVLLIGAAMALTEERVDVATLAQMLGMDAVVTATDTSLALAGALLLHVDLRAVVLLAVPAATVFVAYRSYIAERQRHERLEFLYEATRTLSRAPEMAVAIDGLLDRSLAAFRAEVAEIVLFDPSDGPALRTTLGPGEHRETMQPLDAEIADALRAIVGGGRAVSRFSPQELEGRLRTHLEARGITHAMLAVLAGEQRVVGAMMLANRFGVVKSFGDDDAKLFEALANNASVALQYDRMEQAVWRLRELQEQLHHQAFHDPLTDLANRTLFARSVEEAVASVEQEHAVLFIDLDDFKLVNDTLGHAVGDELLVRIAERLCDAVRPSDLVARLGGDEFAVLVAGGEDARATATAVVQRIVAAFGEPVATDAGSLTVRVSVGIATTRHCGHRAAELMRNADVAMYRAKSEGKGGFRLFDPTMREELVNRHGLKADLERAIERDELSVQYQPIVELATRRLVALEALVRWTHPGRGRVSPSEFVPIAEQTGSILEVGRFVLERACRQVGARGAWLADGPGAAVHVNLSAVELRDPGLVDAVGDSLARTGVPPSRLVLEITESVLLADGDDATHVLRELRALGVRLALDDFGTGYSSLAYLRELPLDMLKIAKPFVDGLGRGAKESAFVLMMVELGRSLGMQVIAEGIESAEQVERLLEAGCTLGQGFHLGRPADLPGALPLAGRRAAART